jgi:hypothetical protein
MTKRDQSEIVQLKLRIKERLREQMELSARERGVSMNSEINYRLENSIEYTRRIEDVFGDSQIFAIVKIIATAMTEIGRSEYLHSRRFRDEGVRWLGDPYAYDEAVGAALKVLEALRPPGKIVVPEPERLPNGTLLSPRGIGAASAEASMERIAYATNERSDLGPGLVDRIRRNLQDDGGVNGPRGEIASKAPK